jgi:hypothetical protein
MTAYLLQGDTVDDTSNREAFVNCGVEGVELDIPGHSTPMSS